MRSSAILGASIALLIARCANAATIVRTFTDTDCQIPSQEASGPTNGTCVGVIRGLSWMVTSWDDGCLVHMGDDVYGDDVLRSCSAITAQAQTAYTQHCYSPELNFTHYSITNCSAQGSNDYQLFGVESSSTTTLAPTGILLDGRPTATGTATSTATPASASAAQTSAAANPSDSATSASSDASSQQTTSGGSSGLSRGATIAIGVTIPVVVILAVLAVGLIIVRRKRAAYANGRRRVEAEEQHGRSEMEVPGENHEMEVPEKRYEMAAEEKALPGLTRTQELG